MFYLSMYPWFDAVFVVVVAVVVVGHETLAISGRALYTQIHANARLAFSSNKPKAFMWQPKGSRSFILNSSSATWVLRLA